MQTTIASDGMGQEEEDLGMDQRPLLARFLSSTKNALFGGMFSIKRVVSPVAAPGRIAAFLH